MVNIDDRLQFRKHVIACCLKDTRQLNSLSRISKNFQKLEQLIRRAKLRSTYLFILWVQDVERVFLSDFNYTRTTDIVELRIVLNNARNHLNLVGWSTLFGVGDIPGWYRYVLGLFLIHVLFYFHHGPLLYIMTLHCIYCTSLESYTCINLLPDIVCC